MEWDLVDSTNMQIGMTDQIHRIERNVNILDVFIQTLWMD